MILSLESLVTSFLKKLSGIRWYILVDREKNKVVDKSPVIPEEKIDELVKASMLSFELSEKMRKYSLVTSSKEPVTNTIYIKLNGEGIEIENIGKHTFILNIDEKILDTLSNIFTKIRKGETIKCKVCGHNLLYETIECPRCGRTIPFILDKCPFCGYSVNVKKCPKHGGFITSTGDLVKRDYSIIMITVLIAVLIAGFSVFLATYFPGLQWIIYGLGGLVSALTVLVGYIASSPH